LRKLSWVLLFITSDTMGLLALAQQAVVEAAVMNANQQPPFGLQNLGRVVTKREPYCAPISGKRVEIQHVMVTTCDNGLFRTDELKEGVVLDDGRLCTSVADIRECSLCLSLVHADNSHVCPACGRTFCLSCVQTIETEGQKVRICLSCAKEAKTPTVVRILKNVIWGS
jgi:hypothetical protein